jgi:chromosome segregation ATPase
MQEDKQKHQAQAQQMMRSLTAQKNTLTKEIAEKEKELKKTKDPSTIKKLNDEIIVLKNKLKDIDKEIKYLHDSK